MFLLIDVLAVCPLSLRQVEWAKTQCQKPLSSDFTDNKHDPDSGV